MNSCHLTTPRVQRWLAHTKEARILHLFPEVCNLVNEEEQVLSLVSRRIGAGPFALVLPAGGKWPGRGSDRVWIDHRAGRLHAGSLAVRYEHTPCWQPVPPWARLRTRHLGGNRPLPAIDPACARLLEALLEGLRHRERATVRQATAQLAGRGTGLTPTGDDLLVGVLYALQAWPPVLGAPRRGWSAVIAETAAPLTTILSAAFLRAAAAGEATAPWHRLVDGEAGAVSQIVATGHRSGSETWAAFIIAGNRLSCERG